MRILTVTLHPCIDRVMRLDKLKPGALHDARLEAEHPAGKGVNTARVLRSLLPPAHEITALAWGGDADRAFFETSLAAENIKTVYAPRPCRTRRALTLLEKDGRETHIKEAMPAPGKDECAQLLEAARAAFAGMDAVAFCGSAPAGTPLPFLKELLALARSSTRYLLADSNGPLLKLAAQSSPDLLKGNAAEIGAWLGLPKPWNPVKERDQDALATRLQAKNAAKRLLITLGAEGGVLTQTGYTIQQPAPKLKARKKPVSATGCGDAATAGWLAGIALRKKSPDCLELALKSGTAKLYSSDPGKLG